MCRFAAYRGKPILLEQLISKTEHSLVEQSYKPAEMTAGTVNVDGFGFAWYDAALSGRPCVYTNTVPIWSDHNLEGLGSHISSSCILGNVRSATPGFGLSPMNCQPFSHGRLSFMHNGFIDRFDQEVMRRLRETLRDDYYRLIKGNTDSEHIFALILNFLHDKPQTVKSYLSAVRQAIVQLLEWTRPSELYMATNIVLSDGDSIVALRFATNSPHPSLYFSSASKDFSGGEVLASEKLSEDPSWCSVPEGHTIVLRNGDDPIVARFLEEVER